MLKARIARLFTDHPASVGESYGEHALVAMRFGGEMIAGGVACLVHAAVPALFGRTGSGTVRRLHARMSGRGRTIRSAPDRLRGWTYEI